jgi:thioredoxin 1
MSDTDDIDRLREQKRETLLGSSEGSEDASTPGEPIHVDGSEELQETVGEYPVVLLEFYADWCGPCKMLEPVLEELAATTDAAVAKVDVDQNQRLASQYQVRGVPTMVLFDDGEVAEQMTGARDQNTLERLIENHAG